jgi:hypothetical protein
VTAQAPPSPGGSPLAAAGARLAALLAGAASAAWAAVPLRGSGWAAFALVIAAACVIMGSARLALLEVPESDEVYFLSAPERMWHGFVALARWVSWEEIGCAAILWLEVQHPARPWHTAVLGVALVAWLLAVHVAESGTPARTLLRRQAKVLIAGLCLLALAAAAAALPDASSGAGAAALRVLSAVAVIAAAILVLPG